MYIPEVSVDSCHVPVCMVQKSAHSEVHSMKETQVG